jgi:hypothetical protein
MLRVERWRSIRDGSSSWRVRGTQGRIKALARLGAHSVYCLQTSPNAKATNYALAQPEQNHHETPPPKHYNSTSWATGTTRGRTTDKVIAK